jgi:hypothetical protein
MLIIVPVKRRLEIMEETRIVHPLSNSLLALQHGGVNVYTNRLRANISLVGINLLQYFESVQQMYH